MQPKQTLSSHSTDISKSNLGPTVKRLEAFNASDRVDVKLLDNGVHFLVGEICEENVNETIKWIVYENLDKRSDKILTLYINSAGGDLYQAFALIDIMKTSKHPVRTIGIGAVMSAGFLIFASGSKGERYIGINTGIMCHQFSGGMEAKYHDIKAEVKEADLTNRKMVDILRDATGLTTTKIKSKLLPASDVYLTINEVIELGIADHILG
jgi:ATP-dependent Clp protease protease subunit